ncbi:hypothetical protein [Caballeronia sp. AZ7_KS35]|nr:hypothetical protein [Caballeronia sp. AZ7_KS35]
MGSGTAQVASVSGLNVEMIDIWSLEEGNGDSDVQPRSAGRK